MTSHDNDIIMSMTVVLTDYNWMLIMFSSSCNCGVIIIVLGPWEEDHRKEDNDHDCVFTLLLIEPLL